MKNDPSFIKTPWLKNLFDKLMAILLLIISGPFMIIIASLILLESTFIKNAKGPIFYKDPRMSHGQPFMLLKFRIFSRKCLEMMDTSTTCIETKPLEQDNKNLTLIGRYLKKWYLDEMPQLLNILKGDMSFVGPRPWNFKDYTEEINQNILRKKVLRAGLVGPVQIAKEDPDKFANQVQLDQEYIEFIKTNSQVVIVLYDLTIMIKAIQVLMRGKGL